MRINLICPERRRKWKLYLLARQMVFQFVALHGPVWLISPGEDPLPVYPEMDDIYPEAARFIREQRGRCP